MQVVLLVLALCYHGVVPATIVVPTTQDDGNKQVDNNASEKVKPEVYSLHVDSDIRYRFAHTVISSRIANPANVSQEVSFTAVLPETAFISGFSLEVDGKVYDAYVKEKEEAKREYTEAVNRGDTAAHVALNARDSNRFTVSVNVEPQKKVTFNLTYEELLTRTLGEYKHVINLDPGQIVRDLSVEVRIEESSDITKLAVPAIRTSNEIDNSKTDENNPLATITRPTKHSAVIKFTPNPEQQRELASEGIKGQLIVQYDVDRTSRPGEVLVNDGYFVHFFSPSDLPSLPKQVTFVLDVSGSMSGRKIEQLRQAMSTILGDLNPKDLFSIVLFSDIALVWDLALNESSVDRLIEGNRVREDNTLTPTVIAAATPENVTKAKQFVEKLQVVGGTNIYDGLQKALEIANLRRSILPAEDSQKYEPIIIFLTDGQPNTGIGDPKTIVSTFTDANAGGSSIFSLALGSDADFDFLKKLSLRNTGFARKIYEASDTALQLGDFYRQVASPLLANVTFKYQPEQVEEKSLTTQTFRRLFSGAELVVAGRLLNNNNLTGSVAASSVSGDKAYPFIPTLLPEVVPLPEENRTVSPMERLWAYLTIQQLLEEDAAKDREKNATSPEKQQALELALKYSFVTPLTSLVVVKPNDTGAVDTEDASEDKKEFSKYGGQHNKVGGQYLSTTFARPIQFAPPPPQPVGPYPMLPMMEAAEVEFESDQTESYDLTTTFLPVQTTLLPDESRVVSLNDITWLSSNNTDLLINGVNGTEVYHLGSANETNVAFSPCFKPGGNTGHCRHLRYCVLDVFADDRQQFLEYFCPIESFIGVCCPDNIQH